MVRPERLLALHRQGRLLSSFHLLSHLWEASNITTRAISQFSRPVFHRQDTQHYGLQTKVQMKVFRCAHIAEQLNRGVPPKVVVEVVGHSDSRSISKYAGINI